LGLVNGEYLCALLKKTSPKIYKDQLTATKKIISTHTKKYDCIEPELLERILTSSRLTATQLRDMLAAYQQHSERLKSDESENTIHGNASKELSIYAKLNVHSGGQGESHVVH
jgi:C-terminal processing protease CtpA/Prc